MLELIERTTMSPLWAGAAYAVLWLLLGQGVARGTRWLESRASPAAMGLRYWPAWPFLGKLLSVACSVGFLFWMLINGTYAESDVGLGPVDWANWRPWLPGVVATSAMWLAILWGGYWRATRNQAQRNNEMRSWPHDGGLWGHILRPLGQEASAAILRASLMPLAGNYWGVWVATVSKMAISRLDPLAGSRLKQQSQRGFVYLDWALDWIGAAIFVLSGSIWPALLGRALCYSVALGTHAYLVRRRAPRQATSAPISADN